MIASFTTIAARFLLISPAGPVSDRQAWAIPGDMEDDAEDLLRRQAKRGEGWQLVPTVTATDEDHRAALRHFFGCTDAEYREQVAAGPLFPVCNPVSRGAAALGKVRSARKTEAVTANAEKARAARREPAACTCGRTDGNHKWDCPSYRRAAIAKYRAKKEN